MATQQWFQNQQRNIKIVLKHSNSSFNLFGRLDRQLPDSWNEQLKSWISKKYPKIQKKRF
ncbi:hypothetical protein TTHERM_00899370 (macronuclear) [Tetrahymena thermophila SB210]|uniref:Uncharacterized protein n=1 Tax=Tetrahymena thermophila (strain SB210) TaxID=312017 RepID=Q23YC6_TETTS|nr:hypothetical protein TTHERM_00899370 [Tetrahymena thermophila SB210]EAS01538.1 hypothetical protein TTHERM_00899370 [Tetrahymena thermophila SB210]|eukprot:XP_001021783.1 hypothetical protein TTHERM_00899370 [Tetrahymena thermophila SB210]